MGAGAQTCGPSSEAFPSILVGSWSNCNLNWCPNGILAWQVEATMLAPSLLCIPKEWPILDISYKWIHMICGVSLFLLNIPSWLHMDELSSFLLFSCLETSHCVTQLLGDRHVSCFWCLTTKNNASRRFVSGFCCGYVFSLLSGVYLDVQPLDDVGMLFHFLRICQTVFQSRCTSSHIPTRRCCTTSPRGVITAPGGEAMYPESQDKFSGCASA